MSRRSCHGPCQQGRLPCRTPQACQLEEERSAPWSVMGAALVLTVIATAFLLAWMMP